MIYNILLANHFEWSGPLLFDLCCVAAIYVFLVKRYTTVKLHQKQALFFFLGLGLLYLMIGSPLSSLSHLSFSTHMVQMSILYFIIPPLLLVGIPDALGHLFMANSVTRRISKLFLRPMIALITFAVLFLLYHVPVVLNMLTLNNFAHSSYLIVLFIMTFSMWWPIAGPDPSRRLSTEQKKRYAFISGLIIMPACVLFIINAMLGSMNNPFMAQLFSELCLPVSSHGIILPPAFNTTMDQLMAGILMLGIHKLGLIMTFHLRKNQKYKQILGNKW